MQEEILTLQFGSFSNAVMNDYWDLEQLNAEEVLRGSPDEMFNSIFVRGDVKRPRTLIFELKDNLEKYSFYQGGVNIQNEQNRFQSWNKGKVQVFNVSGQNDEEEKDQGEGKPSSFSRFSLSERNFVRIPPAGNYFNSFLHGNQVLQNAEAVDAIEDKIRYFLEDSDYLGGFQCFLDTNSGFGTINKHVLQYLSEECNKKHVFQYALDNDPYVQPTKENEKIAESLRFLNKMVNLYELKEYVACYIPVDVEPLKQFKGFNPELLNLAPNKLYNILSLIMSNISLPYRFTNTQASSNTVKGFVDNLLPYPELNVFNACFHLKGFPQILDETKSDEKNDLQSIFRYKDYKPLCLFNISDKEKFSKYTSFSEDYVLRGGLTGVKIPKEFNSMTHNYHLQEASVLLPETVKSLFDPKALSNYEVLYREPNTPGIQKAPIHSCLFTNEIFKYYFEDTVKNYHKVERGAKLQYLKEDFTEDEFKEMENLYLNLRDSYDNARDEGSFEDNGEDDDDF